MNPFEDFKDNSNELFSEEKLLITISRRGRKQNTYLSGWELSKDDLKVHLKNLKKTLGCNGSIKKHEIEGSETTVLHLQGNHKDKLINYLVNKNNVNENNISVRE